MLTRRAKAYSIPMLVCNRFSERLANIGKIATFMRVQFFDALVRRFFERKKSRLGPLKSMFNAENFICILALSLIHI